MIFEEDFVYVKDKGNTQLKQVEVEDEIFAYDLVAKKHVWTQVLKVRKTGEKNLVYITLKNAYHIRMRLQDKLLTGFNDHYESIETIAYEVTKKEGFNNIRVMNQNFTQIAEIKKYGVFPTIELEVNNPDGNYYCNGICVKAAGR
jgi:hypothetical protein